MSEQSSPFAWLSRRMRGAVRGLIDPPHESSPPMSPAPQPPPPVSSGAQPPGASPADGARGDVEEGNPRGDSWGGEGSYGSSARDTAYESATFQPALLNDLALRPHEIRRMMRRHPIARKIVEKQVLMAFGSGLEWTTENLEAWKAELRRTGALHHIKRARVWGRAFGGALLVLNVEGSGTNRQPLDLARVSRLVNIRVVDRWSVQSVQYNTSGGTRDGLPERYTIRAAGASTAETFHHTRVIRFDGLDVDDDTWLRLGGWCDTVLQPPYDALRDMGIGESSLSRQLASAVQTVYKITGLHRAIRNGNAQFIENWIGSVERFRTALRAIVLDAEKEDILHKAAPLGDSAKVYMALLYRISAAADMPATELFGRAPEGFNSEGDSQTRKWYDRIEAEERNGQLGEAIERIVQVLLAQKAWRAALGTSEWVGDEIAWAWPSLWSPTAKEKAEVRKLQADTDVANIGAGIYNAAQIAAIRADMDGIDLDIQPDPTPEPPPMPAD